MSKIDVYESLLVDTIKGVLPTVQVEAFPDKPEAFKPGLDKVILINYEGRKLAGERNTISSMPTFDVLFRLTFAYVNRRNVNGIYSDLETVRAALINLKMDPTNNRTNFLELEGEYFERYNSGSRRWEYIQTYTFKEFYDNV